MDGAILGGAPGRMQSMPVDGSDPERGRLTEPAPQGSKQQARTRCYLIGGSSALVLLIGLGILAAVLLPHSPPEERRHSDPSAAQSWASFDAVTASPAAFNQWCHQQLKIAADAHIAAKQHPQTPLSLLNDADIALGNANSMASVMANAHPSADIRTAAEACTTLLQNYTTQASFDTTMANTLLNLLQEGLFDQAGDWHDAVNNTAALALRYVQDGVTAFRTQGVLPPANGGGTGSESNPPPTEALKQMSAEMLQLGLDFERAVAEDVRSLRIPALDVASTCAGLPQDFLDGRTAQSLGLPTDPGAGQSPQDVVLDTTYPSYFPVIKYATDRSLRRDMATIFNQRGLPDNIPRLARLLQLRWQYARELGFDNWAQLQLQDKMQGNPANTTAFLQRVATALDSAANDDKTALQGLLNADLHANTTGADKSPELQAYDSSFYLNRLQQDRYQVDPKQVRQYFTFAKAREGVLSTASAIFGVHFQVVAPVWGVNYGRGNESQAEFDTWAARVAAANGGVQRWHESVEVLNVYSTRPSALASSWPEVRPHDVSIAGAPTLDGACQGYVSSWDGDAAGEADTTAALEPAMGGSAWSVAAEGAPGAANPPACYMGSGELLGRIYLDMWPREGKYQHAAQFDLRAGVAGVQAPEGTLLTNFPRFGSMEHSQVVTFFHEFGHLMHHVVGGTNSVLQAYSGVATEWDFVEAPSQMLEAWAWSAEVLQAFASNSDGDAIPEGLVDAMVLASGVGRGISNKQQVFYAQLSLGLHMADPTAFQDDLDGTAGNATILTFLKDVQAAWSPYPYLDSTDFAASFGHLIGYGAIYSTYLWSNVIARDMLSVFTTSPFGLLDTLSAGQYTNRIIASGGRGDAASLLDDFLGRPVNFEPFAKWVSNTA